MQQNGLLQFIFLLTLAEVILLIIGGMPVFDAVCHSFSTLVNRRIFNTK